MVSALYVLQGRVFFSGTQRLHVYTFCTCLCVINAFKQVCPNRLIFLTLILFFPSSVLR